METDMSTRMARSAVTFTFHARPLLVLSALAIAACARTDHGRQQYDFIVRVQSDPGSPLARVTLSHAGKPLGASDARGLLRLAARGKEGEMLAFDVRCPTGYRQTNKPLSVVLRQRVEREKLPEYLVTCPPLKRTVVVAVRAEQGANLPIRYLGRELARTDRLGAAHVMLEAEPEESLELTLDTSEQPGLRPSNPSTRFVVGLHDDVVAFKQVFQPMAKPHAFRSRAARGPIRIQTD
jgi:hypothetical protein